MEAYITAITTRVGLKHSVVYSVTELLQDNAAVYGLHVVTLPVVRIQSHYSKSRVPCVVLFFRASTHTPLCTISQQHPATNVFGPHPSPFAHVRHYFGVVITPSYSRLAM